MTATVLLTRPAAQSRRFAADLSARIGHVAVVISPVMDIVLNPAAAAQGLSGAGGLIFTSENGVAACENLAVPPGLPAFCVGARTAQAARRLGFTVHTGPGDLDGLVRLIAAQGWPEDNQPLVHLHGAHVTGDAVSALAAHGIRASARVVYDQAERPLTQAARALLGGADPVILPLFSPRTARILAADMAGAQAPLGIAAISPAVARALAMHTAQAIQIADKTDASSMLDAVVALLGDRKFS